MCGKFFPSSENIFVSAHANPMKVFRGEKPGIIGVSLGLERRKPTRATTG
jgi:hypothetical protein